LFRITKDQRYASAAARRITGSRLAIITNTHSEMDVVKEISGPDVVLSSFGNENDVQRLANEPLYDPDLTASFTKSLERGVHLTNKL